jgi:hypothetical protein
MKHIITCIIFLAAVLRIEGGQGLYYAGDIATETLPLKWTVGVNLTYDENLVPAKKLGDFSLYQPKQVAIPRNLPDSFDSFLLAQENDVINQEINWASYSINSASAGVISITGDSRDWFPIIGIWQNPPPKDQATFLRIPEIPWITGKEQVIEIPIETDGQIFSGNLPPEATLRPEILQEWTTEVTKLDLAGESYDVYAKVIASDSEFTEISVDAQKRVYLPVRYTSWGQNRSFYYRIDTQGLGQHLSDANISSVMTHRIAGKIVETSQRLVSTKCRLKISANQSQKILLHQLRLHLDQQTARSGTEAITSPVYQMGDVAGHHVAVDQIGDVLPSSGEIVFWSPSMAGSYTGTLVSGHEYSRALIGNGVVQSLIINKHGSYSGIIQAKGLPPLRIRGKFSATEATSVSVEVLRGQARERGCRLAFMRMANGSYSIVAKCYFGNANEYHCLAEKVLPRQNTLPTSHTLVMPVDQNSDGIGADVTGIMSVASNSSVRILFRFPGGRTVSQSTQVSAYGMIPLFFDQRKTSLVGKLRYTPGHELGDWLGGMTYQEMRKDGRETYLHGSCVGHPFLGWETAPSAVTVHIEDEYGDITRLAGSYEKGILQADGLEIKLLPNGSLQGYFLSSTKKKFPIMGVALSSQDIWTCYGSFDGMNKITVTGDFQQ